MPGRRIVPAPPIAPRALALAALLLAAGCTLPHWYFDHFEVEGAFAADGSCAVRIDGAPATSEVTRTGVRPGLRANPEPGFAMWALSCVGVGTDSAHPVAQMSPFRLYVEVNFPRGQQLSGGEFPIGLPVPGGYATVGVLRYAPVEHQGFLGAVLEGISGVLTLTSVDSTRVVGSFRFVGQRRNRGL